MDNLKQYFLKTMNRIGEINEVDEFAQLMLSIIKNGNVEINFRRLTETKVFDEIWIKTFETYFNHIDNIIRNPQKVLATEEDIVPVERAKNISPRGIRHLAQNTKYIKEIDKDGTIIPQKVLMVRREEDYGIYENRFIKTLINRIFSFMKRRYDVIMENAESFVEDKIELISSYNIDKKDVGIEEEGTFRQVNFRLDMNIKSELDEESIKKHNQELLQRIENLYRHAKAFKMSSFMVMMEKQPDVFPPIQKTNILLKNVDYQCALKLWLFLDRYTALGFDSETDEKVLILGNNYISDLYNLIALSYITTEANELKAKEGIMEVDYPNRLGKASKIDLPDGYQLLLENNELSPYFLKQSVVNYTEMYNRLIKARKSPKVAMEMVLEDIYTLIDKVAKNFFQVPEDPQVIFKDYANSHELDIDQRIFIMKEKTDVVHRVMKLKEDDLAKTKELYERYAQELAALEKEKEEIKARKLRELQVQKAKEALLKEYTRQIKEQQEKQRKMLQKIAREERLKEARRIREKLKKQQEKEKAKAKENEAKDTPKKGKKKAE